MPPPRNINEVSFLWFSFIILSLIFIYHDYKRDKRQLHAPLERWLKHNNWEFLSKSLEAYDVTTIQKLFALNQDELHQILDKLNRLSTYKKNAILKRFLEFQQSNIDLIQWLETNNLIKYLDAFYQCGFADLNSVRERMNHEILKEIVEKSHGVFADYKKLVMLVNQLNKTSGVLQWLLFLPIHMIFYCSRAIWLTIKITFQLFICILFGAVLKTVFPDDILRRNPTTFLQDLLGNFLDASACRVTWCWRHEMTVGNTAKFVVKLNNKRNLIRYEITGQENIFIEVRNSEVVEEILVEADRSLGRNAFCVTFHPKKAGKYTISVMVKGRHVPGSPFTKTFLPGPVDVSNITVMNGIDVVVVTSGLYYPLKVETRDKYNNLCDINNLLPFCVQISQVGRPDVMIDPELVVFPEREGGKKMLHIKLEEKGCFKAKVTYNGQAIKNGSLLIISLDSTDVELVEKATVKNNVWYPTWYEGYLTPDNMVTKSETQQDNVDKLFDNFRKVYFYFSSRQLSIKEFYLRFIPSRLYTFRISPSTKVLLPTAGSPTVCDYEFKFDDGMQPPVSFLSQKRGLIIGTFAKLLSKNIGGAESFQDKKRYFHNALKRHHHDRDRTWTTVPRKVNFVVDRSNILESSYEATKGFSVSKWCRQFFVKFRNEEGYDAGGVTREWITVLSKALFNTENGLFTQLNKEDRQALVYPNPTRPPSLKLKYYEFAGRIVGKCIYESSCSQARSLNIKARFMRSFLAQLIGLRVNYKYFETDDKQLYTSKIKYIQENNPENLDLYFCEEEYDMSGKLIKEVDLKPNGKTVMVTEANKLEYLDCLSQYKLHTRIVNEKNAFLKGLNEIVPDNLLILFNEQELELLICGCSDISVSDLKKYHKLHTNNSSFNKVMNWFWEIIPLFSQEELSQLLQFATGSSQLPSGGFANLTPEFSFAQHPLYNALPRAHTCFNQLALPDYSTMEEFERCLRIAITEGCEGFGFT